MTGTGLIAGLAGLLILAIIALIITIVLVAAEGSPGHVPAHARRPPVTVAADRDGTRYRVQLAGHQAPATTAASLATMTRVRDKLRDLPAVIL